MAMQEVRSVRDRLYRLVSLGRRMAMHARGAIVIFVIGVAVSVGVALAWKRMYKSETLMLYREGIQSSAFGAAEVVGDPARKLGLRLKEMAHSRTRLEQIIEKFNLYPEIR